MTVVALDRPERSPTGTAPAATSAAAGTARGGVANLAATGFAGVSGLAVTWLVARSLGTAEAGAFFSATASFVLGAALGKLGSQTSLVYWPARLRARGEHGALGRCLRLGLTPVALASVAVAAGLWVAAGFASSPVYAGQLGILAFAVPAAALGDALLAATRGYRVLRPTVALDRLLRPGLQLVLLGGLFLAGAGSPALFAAAWAAPYLPVALLAGYALARAHRTELARAPAHTATLGAGPYWRFTGPRAVASIAQLALQRVDVLLVAALAGLAPAALYAVAGRFVVLGQLVNQSLSQAVQPRLAERLATRDIPGANALYRRSTARLVVLTWPLYLCVAGYPTVYLGLFGNSYRAGAAIVGVLAVTMLAATACGMVDMVLAMGGRTWANLASAGTALVVLLAVDAVLIPRLGAVGAAYGLAAAVLTNNLLPLLQVWRGLRVHPFGRATLVGAGLAAACFGVPALVLQVVAPADAARPLVAAATITAGTAAYLAGLLRSRRLFAPSGEC
ncbi:MAG TPA: polysaccharide biosynthesis C-terminal domain-containing protein [Micromonosporaceae bacterium]|nr:polysaccharide biosynthesis C-terminal domain-containing protein [Micromonosporaceae bacterium]